MFGGYQLFGIGKSHVALVAPLKGGGFAVGPDRQAWGNLACPGYVWECTDWHKLGVLRWGEIFP